MKLIKWFTSMPSRLQESANKKTVRAALSDLRWVTFASGYFASFAMKALLDGVFFVSFSIGVIAFGYWWLSTLNRNSVQGTYDNLKEQAFSLKNLLPGINKVTLWFHDSKGAFGHYKNKVFRITVEDMEEEKDEEDSSQTNG